LCKEYLFLIKIIRAKLHFNPLSIKKKLRLMGYKYFMNSQSSGFTIFSFLIFLAYIFLDSISLKYHCIFSLYKYIYLSIWESLHLPQGIFCRHQLPTTLFTKHRLPVTSHIGLPDINYQPLWLGIMDQIVRTKRLTDYLTYKSYF